MKEKFTNLNRHYDFTDDELFDSLIERLEVREFLAACDGNWIPNANCLRAELKQLKQAVKALQVEPEPFHPDNI